jgi:hypothetical protein
LGLIHILKTDVWRLQIGCTCLEVAAYQVAVWLQAPINIYNVWRLHPATYGGRMAVVSGCSLVADRLQHEKPDTTKQENKQTSKQTYGGCSVSGCRRMAVVSGCTRSKQTYGGCRRMAVVWRLQIGCSMKNQIRPNRKTNRPPNRRMAVVSGCSLVADRLQPGCSRMEVAPGDVWRSYQVAAYQVAVWLHLFGSGCSRMEVAPGDVWRSYQVAVWLQIGCSPVANGPPHYAYGTRPGRAHKPTSVAAEARASMPQWVFVAK